MTNKLLLPHGYKVIGWIILVPATILGFIIITTGYEANWLDTKFFSIITDTALGDTEFFVSSQVNMTQTILGSLFIIGALMVSFSKEKIEDEFIANLRLSSLMWAVWVSYLLLLFAFIFVYGTAFFTVMVYNMFTILILFITRFNYILYRNSKLVSDEK